VRIAVDARALLAGRGVTRYVRRLLTALAEQFPGDDWHAFVPGRAPVETPEGVTLHRHPLGGVKRRTPERRRDEDLDRRGGRNDPVAAVLAAVGGRPRDHSRTSLRRRAPSECSTIGPG